jgi:hypothetical protein
MDKIAILTGHRCRDIVNLHKSSDFPYAEPFKKTINVSSTNVMLWEILRTGRAVLLDAFVAATSLINHAEARTRWFPF